MPPLPGAPGAPMEIRLCWRVCRTDPGAPIKWPREEGEIKPWHRDSLAPKTRHADPWQSAPPPRWLPG
ncbi:hypothetical protein PBY51_016577 [Eleginops maclovinus]|uniref:Uncharacterized protein n=1 Tax=Eleginops maclovinus TaxID=56733 RepID=A0AAN7ZZE0_ELEMC|nr:hypothetical protein PBY51_016577 [Eleginops maclovinus]